MHRMIQTGKGAINVQDDGLGRDCAHDDTDWEGIVHRIIQIRERLCTG